MKAAVYKVALLSLYIQLMPICIALLMTKSNIFMDTNWGANEELFFIITARPQAVYVYWIKVHLACTLEKFTNRHLARDNLQRTDTRWQGVIFSKDSMVEKTLLAPRFKPTAFWLSLSCARCISIWWIAATFCPTHMGPFKWPVHWGPLWLGAGASKLSGTRSELSLILYTLKELPSIWLINKLPQRSLVLLCLLFFRLHS